MVNLGRTIVHVQLICTPSLRSKLPALWEQLSSDLFLLRQLCPDKVLSVTAWV